ncbi:hypothetical protein CYLTODRAFT_489569 [Cylindrobasidium torrendii FP15055 ss-10]|uniref:Killer toxin Kp4 domain-containing protein n=1 Tax=Cylindrobasidium torrendii FP15055 ss-10 TaxID=1314674 RepID=A0A0D7BDQ5_9AGAR|nr:hypothetical protein CYLTODRAFT_489569 [Cylindrobasidium torrendii FP15055 ss-10]
MRFYAILAALVLAVTPEVVNAKSCHRGGVYCGQSLLNRGNYHDHIVRVLEAANQPTDEAHIRASIFDCLSGGDIRFRGYCDKGCGGVGSDDADYCL